MKTYDNTPVLSCKPIISLLGLLAFLANPSLTSSTTSPKSADAIDMKDLVRRAVANHKARQSLSRDYTYQAHCVYSKHDLRDKNTKPASSDYEIMFIDGEQYMRQLTYNGRPLSTEQQQREDIIREAFTKARREGKGAPNKLSSMSTGLGLPFEQLAEGFTLHAKGRQRLDGHEVQVIEAAPNDGREGAGDDEKQARHFKVTLWIDVTEAQIVKFQGTVVKDVVWTHIPTLSGPIEHDPPVVVESRRLRVVYKKGTIISRDWTKLEDGAWLPKHTYWRCIERIWASLPDEKSSTPFLDKSDWTYSNYKKFRVTTRIVP